MFKVGDVVSIKEWDKIDKSNYIDELMVDDSEEYINEIIKSCGKDDYKIIKEITSNEYNILEFDISNGYITKQIYYFEMEPYFKVKLPDELFLI